ncbi:hypothetical protein R1sor_018119 [Riccia sorocarpa]|uniref:RRM domain-containing protein n=1 Tax=Riccia sorocarpa TaxID=122646 RepID=A0ABD3I8Y5_9MARC
MDSPKFLSPILPTWIELVDVPSFISQAQLQQLFSNIGTIIRVPYLSQCISFASVRALVMWDFQQPLVDELCYEVDGLPFRLRLRFLELGELLRQQTIGAQESSQRGDRGAEMQPMEEDMQSAVRLGQVGGQGAAHPAG